MKRYYHDTRGDVGFIDNELNLTIPHWEDCVLDKVEDFEENEITLCHIEKDFYGFCFKPIGQDFGYEFCSPLDFEISVMTASDVFERWVQDFIKVGCFLIEDAKAKGISLKEDTCRFVTVWSYESCQDTYYQEWDSEWDLLGVLDLQTLSLKKVEEYEKISKTG